jgi:hypothetical protein
MFAGRASCEKTVTLASRVASQPTLVSTEETVRIGEKLATFGVNLTAGPFFSQPAGPLRRQQGRASDRIRRWDGGGGSRKRVCARYLIGVP